MNSEKLAMSNGYDVAVLFLIFNRIEITKIVFEEIRKQQPKKLFIAADGPREFIEGEAEQCKLTRNLVLKGIDWDCEVKTLFREENLGCGKAVSTAIDWFFDHVEEGVIIEDDCLPEPGFFSFCKTLLEKYKYNKEIMHITANNFQQGIKRGDGSYYFSRLTHIWGWATWRRAWQKYDFSLETYRHCSTEGIPLKLRMAIDQIYDRTLDTWDVQWFMTVWWSKGVTIIPNINLVKNLGYGNNKKATHTKNSPPNWVRKMRYGRMDVLIHPAKIDVDKDADQFTVKTVYTDNLLKQIAKKILLKNGYKKPN